MQLLQWLVAEQEQASEVLQGSILQLKLFGVATVTGQCLPGRSVKHPDHKTDPAVPCHGCQEALLLQCVMLWRPACFLDRADIHWTILLCVFCSGTLGLMYNACLQQQCCEIRVTFFDHRSQQ